VGVPRSSVPIGGFGPMPVVTSDGAGILDAESVLVFGSADAGSSKNPVTTESTAQRPVTRLQNNINRPKVYMDGTVSYGCLMVSGEPENVEEVLSHEQWRQAMNEEYMVLMKNETWHLVPAHCANNVIHYRWVYKVKQR
jgi:hypothetical protein